MPLVIYLTMVDYANWLGQLNDDTLLGSLTIPGTHNSAACKMALPSVQCQSGSITEQLDNGVRFLDLRVGAYPLKSGEGANDLTVCHGKFPISIPFPTKLTDVLEEIYRWQDNHRSEAIFVSIKDEGTKDFDYDNNEFPRLIKERYLDPAGDRWFLGTSIPRLGDVRGKLILFRRFRVKDENLASQLGFAANSWPYNSTDADRGTFFVQDFCDVQNAEMLPQKLGYIEQLAQKAQQYNSTNSDGKLFVNYTSASNFFDQSCWPQQIAEAIDKTNLLDKVGKGSGIIITDYIDTNNYKLAHGLVDKNF